MQESSKIHTGYGNSNGFFELESVTANFLLIAAAFALCIGGIALPFTRETVLWLLSENRPVEVLTFVVLLVGGAVSLSLVFSLNRKGERKIFSGFYLLFSLGLILTAMEEIAWGQQFFQFETPEALREINMQDEVTLHNIKGMHGNTEFLRLIYGICGMTGVFLFARGYWGKIAAPFFLLPWFAAISVHSAIDIFNDIMPIQKEFDALVSRLAELVELLIGASALIYILVNKRMWRASLGKV